MSKRSLYFLAATVGGILGSLVPGLWGASDFSGWGIFLSTVGGIAGVLAAYKIF